MPETNNFYQLGPPCGDTPGDNWDWIHYDKGEGNNGPYDAWDSENW